MEVACKTVEREHRAVTGRPAGAACRAAPDEVFHALRRSTLPGSRRLWHSCVNGRRDASKRQNRVARQKLETSNGSKALELRWVRWDVGCSVSERGDNCFAVFRGCSATKPKPLVRYH